ncbi:hypothetical protein CJF32_00009926 [Rutstroemia sp. NJR-2017a WRK4]|nr:hypothetical protein CJF32_00009926 [Rutstroemia sp. NJR-2017a WRK4]
MYRKWALCQGQAQALRLFALALFLPTCSSLHIVITNHNHYMDRASQVLAQGVPNGVPKSYRALADYHGDVGYTTLYYRDNGRQSIEEKALG